MRKSFILNSIHYAEMDCFTSIKKTKREKRSRKSNKQDSYQSAKVSFSIFQFFYC